jgi:hypothetical protein
VCVIFSLLPRNQTKDCGGLRGYAHMSAYTEEFLVDKLNKLVNTQESIQSMFVLFGDLLYAVNWCF